MTDSNDRMLRATEAAKIVGLSVPAFWRGVRDGRFPLPLYVASRSPRWWLGELRSALEAHRMRPAEAVARRRRKAA